MSEVKYDKETGAPVRNFPLVMAKGEKVRRVHNEGAYVQAVHDGFAEPETKAEVKAAEKQLPKS